MKLLEFDSPNLHFVEEELPEEAGSDVVATANSWSVITSFTNLCFSILSIRDISRKLVFSTFLLTMKGNEMKVVLVGSICVNLLRNEGQLPHFTGGVYRYYSMQNKGFFYYCKFCWKFDTQQRSTQQG